MEESVTQEFKKVDAGLSDEEKRARIDIRYRTAAGKHIIIEPKRYKVTVKFTFDRLTKKIEQIMEKPEHYKPSRYHLKECRHAFFRPFIIVYETEGDLIRFHYVKHHEKAF